MSSTPRPDRAAFEQTALPHTRILYATARRLTGSPDDAGDLVQETFLRAYRTFSGFTPGTNCKAWLFSIMYSIVANWGRKRRRGFVTLSIDQLEARYGQSLPAEGSGSHREILENPNLGWAGDEVDHALGLLPIEFRAAVLLVDVGGLQYEEASRVLDCPLGTIRSRLSRARKILHRALAEYARERGYCK